MKFINKTILNRLLVLSGFVFLSASLPLKAFALSTDSNQNFSNACPGTAWSSTNWTTTSTFSDYNLYNGSGDAINDVLDVCSVTFYSVFYYTGTFNPADSITITYTDPTPSAPTTYIKFDLYDSSNNNRSFSAIVTDVSGNTALSIAEDIMPNCSESVPVTTGNTVAGGPNWETGYIQVLGPGAVTGPSNTGPIGNIKTVQIIFTGDSQMTSPGTGNPLYLDNLRGDFQLSCLAPTSTATETATSTATLTAVNSYTFTNTPTDTATNTPSETPTNTMTNTLTQTATNTTLGNTPTNTATSTITLTPTITATFTPAPCQIEVYPNPMDFTSSASILNCPTGKCIMFSCLPLNATVKVYTVSLALVRVFSQTAIMTGSNLPPGVGYIAWDGTNGNASPVASGLYFYVVNAPGVNTFGKFAISKSIHGP